MRGGGCSSHPEPFPLNGCEALIRDHLEIARGSPVATFLPPDRADWETAPGHHCPACDATLLGPVPAARHQATCQRLVEGRGEMRNVLLARLLCGNYHPLTDDAPSPSSSASAASFRPNEECLPPAAATDRPTVENRCAEMTADNPQAISKIFRIMVVSSNYKADMMSTIAAKDQAVKTPGVELQRLFDCAKTFCENFPQLVHLVGGHARTALQVYKWDGRGQSDEDGGIQAFAERDRYDRVLHYYKDLLAYLYLFHGDRLRPYLDWMAGPEYSAAAAHERGVLASLLCELTLEETPTGTLTTLSTHSLLYLCRVGGERDLSIVACGRGSQLLSCVQHALRCAVLCKYVLRTSASGSTAKDGMPLITECNNSITMHTLGPHIAILRTLDGQKPSSRRITVDPEWNITIDGHTVLEREWRKFIPRMAKALWDIFDKAFEGGSSIAVWDACTLTHATQLPSSLTASFSPPSYLCIPPQATNGNGPLT